MSGGGATGSRYPLRKGCSSRAREITREKTSYRRYFDTKHTGCQVVIGSYSTLFGATLVATVVFVAENKLHGRKKQRMRRIPQAKKNVPSLGTKK